MRKARYEVILADTPETQRVHFRLRYLVFCQEKGFESADAFPSGQETDEHDRYALHFLIRQGGTNTAWFGAVRLLLPADRPRPIERLCKLQYDLDRARTGEVSRLILTQQAPREAHLPLYLLCQAIHQAGTEHGLDHMLFLIRPGLRRFLDHRGLRLRRFGEPCSHRGLRLPCGNHMDALQYGLFNWRKKEGYPEHVLLPTFRRASALAKSESQPAASRQAVPPYSPPPNVAPSALP